LLSAISIVRITRYWAVHLGCSFDALEKAGSHLIDHSAELADYNGVFAFSRDCALVISIPGQRLDLRKTLASAKCDDGPLDRMARVLQPFSSKVIGPAFIGYADQVAEPIHQPVTLSNAHREAVEALKDACTDQEWEHGGTDISSHPASGVFFGDQLVALAGYEVWGGVIAHISVITHPRFRGCGYGQSAVSDNAARALSEGLVPQYRTLESNLPSLRVADDLGFVRYATSISFRL
jgi:GNAT superfamily N-acetyltransferase